MMVGLVLMLAIWTTPARVHAQSVPPFIPVHPISAVVNLGDPVTLFVVADNALTYQWRLNGADIDGATGTLLVIGSVTLSDLGSYRVVVSNPVGTVQSNPAILSLNAPPQPPTSMPNDNFANAYDITTLSSPITSVNSGTTVEAGEPKHAGKRGTNSVWYSWSSIAEGVASFETTGSTFDTLLAVYTGSQIDKLTPVAGHDDGSVFFSSKLIFNVRAGTTYHIAVDSLGLQTGPFILAWEFTRTRVPLPEIRSHPQSRSVLKGASTTLSVSATDATAYQWYFNGTALLGETAASLLLPNVQRGNVGTYFVRLSNAGAFSVDSLSAILEIGANESVFSYNKISDLRDVSLKSGGLSGGGSTFDGGGGGVVNVPGFVSVSIGGLGQQILNNTNSTVEEDACFECDLVGNASRWYGFEPLHDGLMTIDTVGSDVDTILAVYLDVNAGAFCQSIQGCDTNGAPNGTNSQLTFFAHKETRYVVGINSQSDQEGIIHLNYHLCSPSPPFSLVDNQVVLEVEPTPMAFYNYHWTVDDTPLTTTALPNLPLDPLSNTAHLYSVTYSNKSVVVTTNLGSLLNLTVDLDHDANMFRLKMTGVDDLGYQIETAYPNLTNCYGNWLWLPVDMTEATIEQVGKQRIFEFPIDHPRRFFRVRPPPPAITQKLSP